MSNEIGNKKNMVDREKKNIPHDSDLLPEMSVTKFSDIEGKLLLVRVGSASSPASDANIKEIEEKITALLNNNNVNCLVFVTHHAIDIEIIEKSE